MAPAGRLARILLPILAALVAAPSVGLAQRVQEIGIRADNDNFSFWLPVEARGDHEYTHGARLSVVTAGGSWWGPALAPGAPACDGREAPEQRCLQTTWELGQRIYTPRTNSREVVRDERPHAGWLYGAATATAQREADRHRARLEVGITGPPSLAEFMQVRVHRLGGFWAPRGWDHQLGFEPGVVLGYGYDRVLVAPAVRGVRVAELTSVAEVSVGNVITGAGAGLAAKVGYRVPHPWRVDPRQERGSAAFLTGGVRGDGYLRNLFLDGNTFAEGHRVEKLPAVGQFHIGLGIRVERVEAQFQVVSRTREYRSEPDGHRYSSVGFTYRP
jgi:lipid A 3-O-deacylase